MTSSTLLKELRSILTTGFWQWDVRGPSHLPPGAWLRRVAATGTPLDTFDPTYIHPLLALSVYRGRFAADAADAVRTEHMRLVDAQMTFAGGCRYWSEALDITTQEAAKWFYIFTPPTCVVPLEMRHVAGLLDGMRGELFAALGLPPLPTWAPGDWPDACVRPRFWTEEVRKRNG